MQVMSILQSAGNVVAAFAGHTHTDGYGRDDSGIHYRALNAILETTPGRDCYGFIGAQRQGFLRSCAAR